MAAFFATFFLATFLAATFFFATFFFGAEDAGVAAFFFAAFFFFTFALLAAFSSLRTSFSSSRTTARLIRCPAMRTFFFAGFARVFPPPAPTASACLSWSSYRFNT
ncbi:MAG: hypothetical protein C0485_15225 [Pirellula sp.]|nr:hypothetical protein [Pirellula sp.]